MKSPSRIALVASLTIGMGLLATANLSSPAEKLELNLKPGQVIRYKTVTDTSIDMMGTSVETEVTVVSKTEVLSTDKGWTKLRVSNESYETKGDAQPGEEIVFEAMKDLVFSFEVNRRGLSRNVEMENTESLDPIILETLKASVKAMNFVGFMGVHFPESEILEGSKWETKLDGSEMFGDGETFDSIVGKIPVSFEVLGFENVKGVRHAKIESIMDGVLDMTINSVAGAISATMMMESTTVLLIEMETGIVTKVTSEGEVTTDFGYGSIEQVIKSTIERIK